MPRPMDCTKTKVSITDTILSCNITGRQDIPECGMAGLEYGISVTDGCIGWTETQEILENLAASVRARRTAGHQAVVTVEPVSHPTINEIVRTSNRTRRRSSQVTDFVEKLLHGTAPVEMV